MDFIFILGSNPTLSLAEISAVLGMDKDYSRSSSQVALVKSPDTSPANLINRLAGTIKIGHVIGSFETYNRDELIDFLTTQISRPHGKIKFGISVYSLNQESMAQEMIRDLGSIGLEIKKQLKAEGVSSRYVSSKGHELSSVGVHENKLLESGGEILLVATRDGLMVGQTEVVQDYKAWSHRDYDKPARDAKRGMLPPKLARIMINLALADQHPGNSVLLDPFCGVGTVLMEARLLGLSTMTGSDIDNAAIDQAETNLNWFEEEFGISVSEVELKICDVKKISDCVTEQVDLVVTEPLLGPPQKGHESKKWINDEIEKLTRLYTKAFANLAKVMKPGGRFVITLPVFTHGGEAQYIPLKKIIKGTKLVQEQLIAESAPKQVNQKTPHGGILYGRAGQHVSREIICLKLG